MGMIVAGNVSEHGMCLDRFASAWKYNIDQDQTQETIWHVLHPVQPDTSWHQCPVALELQAISTLQVVMACCGAAYRWRSLAMTVARVLSGADTMDQLAMKTARICRLGRRSYSFVAMWLKIGRWNLTRNRICCIISMKVMYTR
jgi:hypothetical protein